MTFLILRHIIEIRNTKQDLTLINIEQVKNAARGQWLDIFHCAGMDVKANKKHSACPVCGGKDRFRMDDKGGDGTFYCNSCGAGDGLKLLELHFNDQFIEGLKFAANYLGIQDDDSFTDADMERSKSQAKQRQISTALKESGEKAKKEDLAAITIQNIMKSATPADPEHPYLRSKHINPFTAWKIGVDIIIPIVDVNLKLVNCQQIQPSGFKKFRYGAAITGCFHFIGEVFDGCDLVIVEGFATGATIYQQTNISVVVAFNSNNLLPVTENIKHLYPSSKILICGDNDWHLEQGERPIPNAGVKAAARTFIKTGCDFIVPEFARGVTDFNDLYVVYGEGCGLRIIKKFVK